MSKIGKLSIVLCAALLLSACTASKPPSYDLPAREGIMPGEEIVVGRGQNVYGLAKKYGVSMRELIVLNDLKPPFALKQGQRIVLPVKDRDFAPPPTSAPLGSIEKTPLGGSSSSVTSAPLEPVASGPSPGLPPAMPFKPADDPLTSETLHLLPKNVATTVPASETLQPPSAPATKMAMATPTKQVAPPAASGASGSFDWPLQGPVLSGFGPKGQGQNNDGINIAAPKGSPVVAASGGIVVYAGNEMKGFGNLVLIRHEGGWVTAYAHLDRMLVAKDTVVAPGDMIGTVGSSGGVSAPQLHFETRLDGKAVDPQTVIKKAN